MVLRSFVTGGSQLSYWVTLVIVLVVVGLTEYVGLTTTVRSGGEQVLQPLFLLSNRVVKVLSLPTETLRSATTAKRRIQDVEQRYAEALAQLSELDAVKAENQALRDLLQAPASPNQQRIISVPIIAYGQPLVAAGQVAGVQAGALVLVSQTLIGRISAVSAYQSEVTLLTQSDAPPVVAVTESGAQGLVVGDGRRVLLKELPSNVEIAVGQRVVTQGQAGVPAHLFVGKVAAVMSQPSAATQVAVLEQFVSFYEAEIVEIR